jgi:acyl dehydratase
MSSGYFEDIEVGDSQKAGPYSVSKDEIIQFAEKYDPRPFHIDEAAAARSVFAGLSASAAHTFAIFYSLTNKLHPPIRAIAALGYDELRLPNPVRPDDELDLDVRVLEKRESKSKSDRGIFRFRAFLRNQRRETVLECISNILVARRPDANAPTRIEKTDGS